MTHGLMNLIAFSVQLAVLVGAGAIAMTALRVDAPRASLRFWQTLFAAALLWPLYQLREGPTVVATFSPPLSWTFSPASPTVGVVVAAGDGAGANAVVTIVVLGVMVRLGWLALGLVLLR